MTSKRDLEKRLEDLRGDAEDDPGRWADLPELTSEEKEALRKTFDVVPATVADLEMWGEDDSHDE